jgi:GntR family transcriptional regulator/MocR family aminotransferase
LPVDAQGLQIGAALRHCRYVYVTPSHQAPTTVTMPVDRRVELLRRAERDDLLIIEDDYETETTFSGLPNPALKSLDRAGRVIYVGSLSKSFAPGLRIGYVVAPKPLIDELRALRRLNIRHPSTFLQRSIARFVALGHYDLLSRRLVDAHRERARILAAAVTEFELPVVHQPVNGGSSVWFEGPEWLDARLLAERLREDRVLIEPGDVHYMDERPPLNRFRLGFSSIPRSRIREGISRLSTALTRLQPR